MYFSDSKLSDYIRVRNYRAVAAQGRLKGSDLNSRCATLDRLQRQSTRVPSLLDTILFVVVQQRKHIAARQFLAALQEIQFYYEAQASDLSPQ
jgi:hypothetical protein